MYLNSGYLNNTHLDFKDKSRPLIVGSCGTYRLSTHPRLPTYRPRGGWIFSSSMSLPGPCISTLTMQKMKPL